MEALGLAATCHSGTYKNLATQMNSYHKPPYESKSLFDILSAVREDKDLDGLFTTPGNNNLKTLLTSQNPAFLAHCNAWKIENPTEQFRESQQLAAALLIGTTTADSNNYDWFFAMTLATSHAVRVMLPSIPAKFQIPLIRQWWLNTLGIYIAQLRPEIDMERIHKFDLKEKDWDWVSQQALKGVFSTDVSFVRTTRALREQAETWGDHDRFFLKAAVLFVSEFNNSQGWRNGSVGSEL